MQDVMAKKRQVSSTSKKQQKFDLASLVNILYFFVKLIEKFNASID